MLPRHIFSSVALVVFAGCLLSTSALARTTADMGPAALTGTVKSVEEGKMEGVIVSVQRDGSNITVSVISDENGHYTFPAARVTPGHYALRIRAVGYDLKAPSAADVVAGRPTTVDIALKKAADLESQLTSAEWLESIPGTDQQKRFLNDCVNCHTLQRVMQSKFTADQFLQIFKLMGTFYQGSTPEHPQTIVGAHRSRVDSKIMKAAAAYLASVNLSTGPRKYPLKTLPRPTGKATHVIITTYQLPREDAMPHDTNTWSNSPSYNGHVWYSDFGSEYIGELDPATGKVVDYQIPLMRPEEPRGSQDTVLAPDGHIWIHTMSQGGFGEFAPQTKTFTMYKYPKDGVALGGAEASHMNVDGYVWGKSIRYNVRTGKWQDLGTLKCPDGHPIHAYGTLTDDENNLYEMDFADTRIGRIERIDAKTGRVTCWATPSEYSRPRRGHWGPDGTKIWFAEFGANKIASFDPKTGKFREWRVPMQWELPYDVIRTKKGDVWTGSMFTDRVIRFSPDTGEWTAYLLPDPTCIRHVDYDDKSHAFWISGVDTGTIVRVEPLD
jgi:streptogramin lyase